MDLQHAQDTGAGLVVEASVASRSPRSGFPSSALEVGQRNTPLLFRYLSPSPASCPSRATPQLQGLGQVMAHHIKAAFPTCFPLLSSPYGAVSRRKMPQACSCTGFTVAAPVQALITQSLAALVHGGTRMKPSACMQDVERPADPTYSTKNTVQHRRRAQRALGLGETGVLCSLGRARLEGEQGSIPSARQGICVGDLSAPCSAPPTFLLTELGVSGAPTTSMIWSLASPLPSSMPSPAWPSGWAPSALRGPILPALASAS